MHYFMECILYPLPYSTLLAQIKGLGCITLLHYQIPQIVIKTKAKLNYSLDHEVCLHDPSELNKLQAKTKVQRSNLL